MELKEDIKYALEWVEEFRTFKDSYDFIDYVHDYIFELLEIEKLECYKNIFCRKTYFKMELCILGFSFILVNNIYEVVVYKKHNNIKETIGRYLVFEKKYQIKDKKLKYFHPKYINILLEEAFGDFFTIAKEMKETEFFIKE